MSSCDYNAETFGRYFTENMTALGLSTPNGIYESSLATFGIIGTLAEVAHLNPNMPVSLAWRGALMFEKAKLLTAVGASYYTGAMIGSAAVAIGRIGGCGATIADAIWLARENGIFGTWVEHELVSHPEFVNPIKR